MKPLSRSAKGWLLVFALWGLLLTGILSPLVSTPGVVQALRLSNLLAAKQEQAGQLETEIKSLNEQKLRLEKSPVAQKREIRKVLGYAASDELIFDFAARR